MKLKKGDNVIVITGRDKGKSGKIERVYTKTGKISVSGINILKKHTKSQGKKVKQAGIIEIAGALNPSKVMLVCPKCSRPSRIAYKVGEKSKERICKKCNESIG